jgi:predicted AAA+ superfamily ATPase
MSNLYFMIERSHLLTLTKRIQEPRRFIQVIMGPRQTGKTTLAFQLLEKNNIAGIYESADAVPAGNRLWLEQIWETARVKLKTGQTSEILLIIDEIQKIPGWSETVKKLWDEDSRNHLPLKAILLGSSRLMLQSGHTESLAGRFEVTYMGHWSLPEMQAAFGWNAEQYAWFGGYPGSAGLITDELRWKQYICNSLIETSISRDILMLTRIDKPALLKRLFELGCLYSGQILSFTKIMGQLQDAGNTTTLSYYLHLLNTAGLLGGIEKYAADVIRKRSSVPKFQVHNNALLSAQSTSDFYEILQKPSEWGRVVESAIGAHLMNAANYPGLSLYYWRERNHEVDFILELNGKLMAVEVKSNESVPNKGITAFRNLYPTAKVMLVGKSGFPWQEFLTINPLDLF